MGGTGACYKLVDRRHKFDYNKFKCNNFVIFERELTQIYQDSALVLFTAPGKEKMRGNQYEK